MSKTTEKAVQCSNNLCKEVFHVYEIYEPGGINDRGFIAVRCKKCGTITKIRMKNPSKNGIYENFEIVDAWEDGEYSEYNGSEGGKTAVVVNKEPSEGVQIPFEPQYQYPFWQDEKNNLELLADAHFKRISGVVKGQLEGLKNYYLKSKPGFDDIQRCIVCQEYEEDGEVYHARWAKFLRNEDTMNTDFFHLVCHSSNKKRIDGVYSRDEMMAYLVRCLMKWKLLANQVVVVTPFIGFDFFFSKLEVKKELIMLWGVLNSLLDVDKTQFITRLSTYASLKKYQKEYDVPADVQSEWDLMNNLQKIVYNPKSRLKTLSQFHTKFYAGIFDDYVELLSGSFNVQTGRVLEQMHLRCIPRELFKKSYMDRLVEGFEYDDRFNPKTLFIDLKKSGEVGCRISGLKEGLYYQ